MLDLHGRATLPQARILIEALAPLKPLFIEEPVRPELVGRLDRITSTSTVPIAMGERLYARHEFLQALEAGAAVVQPDLSHAGGITEARRIADLAEMFDAAFAPHCPLGPVTLASSLQVDAVAPTFLIQEQSIDIHAGRSDALSWLVDTTPLRPVDGSVPLLTGPGLGLEIDEAAVRQAARDHRFRSPIWHRSDGSFTEW
ncbi:hypothetical protein GCM10025864_14330 [Luteimicrobium album]|uniref:Enolase C-terminal domain-containing protein n=2 Tax=Luteimicrobium album TaxID=1054550 RepID=A0ABQ6I1N1_9MICO|nr:hypothetical protein GCM10025864_14330 [Luteimicrobium album]